MPPRVVPGGLLVVLEGIDGSGKTTLAGAIAGALEGDGYHVVSTREPTDGAFGRRIRAVARTGREAITGEEEFQLFHQDRIEHVREVVRPALASGAIVVQDRSHFSSVAYQGERGVDRDRILLLSRAVAPDPDVLIVVDVPPEVALERIRASRGLKPDGFEELESLRHIRGVFLRLEKATIIDGRLPVGESLSLARDAIRGALLRREKHE